jgi:hypothetical protein|nr:MAG TPA: hypothetical protein [Caudoviricetes sp.]
MEICNLDYDELLEERKSIEKRMVKKLVSKKDTKIYELKRGHKDNILSFTPRSVLDCTNKSVSCYTRYKYGHLSQEIHEYRDERYFLERKIKNILPVYGVKFFHIFIADVLMCYENVRKYCDEQEIPMITKREHKEILKLVIKWREASAKLHYKPTKQEKRKLKKLNNIKNFL